MFKLGTNDIWQRGVNKYDNLSTKASILKQLGYGYVFEFLEVPEVLKVLEIGHGASSSLFREFSGRHELWGVDDIILSSSVPPSHFNAMQSDQEQVKFVRGVMGEFLEELPENYFDLVCSVSVIEHIPSELISDVLKDISRVLKPGGISAHSYDVWWGQDVEYMIDAHSQTDFDLEARGSIEVPWFESNNQPYLGATKFHGSITHESISTIYNVFMASMENREKLNIVNWCTFLIEARKPDLIKS